MVAHHLHNRTVTMHQNGFTPFSAVGRTFASLPRLLMRSLVALLGLTLGALTLVGAPQALAASDVTPPVLLDAYLTSPDTFDAEGTATNIYFTMMMTDDLSGVGLTVLHYTSPSGHQSWGGTCSSSFVGQVDCQSSLPQYAETGVWTPSLTLSDNSGNPLDYTNAQLLALGYDLRVTLTGTGDNTMPTLVSASRTSTYSQDISGAAGGLITATGTVSDDLSGMGLPTLTYTSPSGNQSAGSIISVPENGVWASQTTVPQYAETGVWTPSLIVQDNVGNSVSFTNAQLLALGIDLRAQFTGTGDITPPTITAMKIGLSSPVVDVLPAGGALVTINATITDNLSGVGASQIAYTSPTGQQHVGGTFSQTSANTYQFNVTLPMYGESGTWQPTLTLKDNANNATVYSGATLASMGFPISFSVTKSITTHALPGDTVTSDTEGNGTTALDPNEASVTSPYEGDVSIVMVASAAVTDATNGYTFFDRQINIVAPGATVENPLTLAFQIDASKVPAGESASTLSVTKNGSTIAACTDTTTATPDPCVFERTDTPSGGIIVKIHSTSASIWSSGFPTHSAASFKSYLAPLRNLPAVNHAEAGQIIPVRFAMEGTTSTDVLAPGQPTSVRVSCTTGSLIGTASATATVGNVPLVRLFGTYLYLWRTDRKWNNTCRQFSLKLKDGSVHPFTIAF